MILTDYSSILHRCIHASVKVTREAMIKADGNDLNYYDTDGMYLTKKFITTTKAFIFQELIQVKQLYGTKFGEIILCFDDTSHQYWRKTFYPDYKGQRKIVTEASPINYDEVFAELNLFGQLFVKFTSIPCISVIGGEADDIILVLAKRFGITEPILIYSPDKDFLQSQRTSDNVKQYSPKTKKWLVPENKNDNMAEWLIEHVCLGDISDNVPKIVDFTIFSDTFDAWIEKIGLEVLEPYEFYQKYTKEKAFALMEKFDVYKTNRKGETLPVKDIFNNPALGVKTLHKKIAKFGSLDAYLDSHPMYREGYERNYKLVMEEGIPEEIVNDIMLKYEEADRTYDEYEVKKFLTKEKIPQFIFDLPLMFGQGVKKEIDASFFDNTNAW